jgi:hypothetical protein
VVLLLVESVLQERLFLVLLFGYIMAELVVDKMLLEVAEHQAVAQALVQLVETVQQLVEAVAAAAALIP